MTGRPNDYRIAALEAQLIRAVEVLRWYSHEVPPARPSRSVHEADGGGPIIALCRHDGGGRDFNW